MFSRSGRVHPPEGEAHRLQLVHGVVLEGGEHPLGGVLAFGGGVLQGKSDELVSGDVPNSNGSWSARGWTR